MERVYDSVDINLRKAKQNSSRDKIVQKSQNAIS